MPDRNARKNQRPSAAALKAAAEKARQASVSTTPSSERTRTAKVVTKKNPLYKCRQHKIWHDGRCPQCHPKR